MWRYSLDPVKYSTSSTAPIVERESTKMRMSNHEIDAMNSEPYSVRAKLARQKLGTIIRSETRSLEQLQDHLINMNVRVDAKESGNGGLLSSRDADGSGTKKRFQSMYLNSKSHAKTRVGNNDDIVSTLKLKMGSKSTNEFLSPVRKHDHDGKKTGEHNAQDAGILMLVKTALNQIDAQGDSKMERQSPARNVEDESGSSEKGIREDKNTHSIARGHQNIKSKAVKSEYDAEGRRGATMSRSTSSGNSLSSSSVMHGGKPIATVHREKSAVQGVCAFVGRERSSRCNDGNNEEEEMKSSALSRMENSGSARSLKTRKYEGRGRHATQAKCERNAAA